MTTPLFLLRCLEAGVSIPDLDELEIGLILDIWTERSNDEYEYPMVATQEDFDRF